MNRTNIILIGLLIAQLIALVIFNLPGSSADVDIGGRLIEGFEAGNITEVTITDNAGESIRLMLVEGDWVLPEYDNFPAMTSSVMTFLDRIPNLTTDRLIAESSTSHRQLGVAEDDYRRLIQLKSNEDTTNLYIGTAAGTNANHARIGEEDRVYLTSGLSTIDASINITSWIDTQYFTLPPENVISFTLENADGLYEFERVDEQWILRGLSEGETLDQTTFTTLLDSALALRLSEPLSNEVEEGYGLEEPSATITIVTEEPITQSPDDEEDGDEAETSRARRTFTLDFGAERDNGVVTKASNSNFYVLVPSFTAQRFVDATREDFLLELPDAEATEEGLPDLLPPVGADGDD